MSFNVRSSHLAKTCVGRAGLRLMLALFAVGFGGSFDAAQAAVCQLVQSGTAVNTANGIQTIGISSVDTTKSILIFQARSNSNRPVASEVRGRLQTATTIQFERVTDEVSPAAINIQWYVVTFGSGVTVQRGETTQSAVTKNVAITAVGALSRAFVLWSKTAVNSDAGWGADDSVLGELTTTANLQFRANYIDPNRNALLQFDLANSDRTICTVEYTLHKASLSVTRPISKLWHRRWILTRNWKFQIRVLTSDRENNQRPRPPAFIHHIVMTGCTATNCS